MPNASGQVPTIMLHSLLQLHKPCPCAFMAVERQRIDKARNIISMEALKNGCDYLLFVDDDNPIPPDTLEKLLEDDKDIVSAIILSRNPVDGEYPICAFYAEEYDVDGGKIKLYSPVRKFKEKEDLHKVDAAGTGCILIKRRVLEVMFAKYQDHIFEFGDIKFKKKIRVKGKDYDRRTMSEDCEFSERAVNLGFEIWIDERVRPIHLSGIKSVQWQNG